MLKVDVHMRCLKMVQGSIARISDVNKGLLASLAV